MRRVAILMSGGGGTRLWPLSRDDYPKQFIKMFDERSLFQESLERAVKLVGLENVYLVTHEKYYYHALNQAEEVKLNLREENVLREPEKKNTAPALLYCLIRKFEDDVIAYVMPSDHVIRGEENFLSCMERGAEAAAEGYLVTLGVKPRYPTSAYGYILPGKELFDGVSTVMRFVEKPEIKLSRKLIEEGALWNSGILIVRKKVFEEEARKFIPEVYEKFLSEDDIDKIYAEVQSVSMEYGVMEKTSKAAVVRASFYWNDVGSFDSLYDELPKDNVGNGFRGRIITKDSFENLIVSNKLVALIGVRDLIVVDTEDAMLVLPRGESQKVRELTKDLLSRGLSEAKHHVTVYRPWGSYTLLEQRDRYKVRKVVVRPGRRLSLQLHYHRSEHWMVLRGMAKILREGEEIFLRPGESTFIPPGAPHRLENPGKIDLELIEVQIGDYLGEDDVVRFEDDYE